MDIINISFDGWQKVILTVNWFAVIVLFILLFTVAWIIQKVNKRIARRSLRIDEAKLGIGNNSVVIKFDKKDQEIAYKLWVELSTRKIGLLFDEENDVIVEVYNSWYDFFRIARDLLKEIPVSRLSYSGELVELTQKVLNEGLRPHLTVWQAKYRKWYEEANKNKGTPQEIQRQYPEYDELIADLMKTNSLLIEYKNCMHDIAFNISSKP